MIAPWDLDQTFNYWQEADSDNPVYWTPIAYLMYYRDPNICDEIRAKYDDLRATAWSDEAINAMIDEYEDEIIGSGAYARTKERWPDGNYQESDYSLDQFRTYVFARLEWMDSLVANLDNTYALQ